jgi:hypothetical protein
LGRALGRALRGDAEAASSGQTTAGEVNYKRPGQTTALPADEAAGGAVVRSQVAETLQRDVGLILNEQIAGSVPQGYAGHHLISIHLADGSIAMQRAAQLGYNINRGSNGIALPTTLAESQASGLPLHSGRHLSARHAGSADAFVQQRLDALDARVRAGTITDQELLAEISRVEDATRQALRTHQARLQTNDPHWRPSQQGSEQ